MGQDRPFVINPELTGIALAYKNDDYIADLVLPRTKVGKEQFAYNEYPKSTYMQTVDGKIGRKGEPETIELKANRKISEVDYYSVMAEVPEADVMAANDGDAGVDPMYDNTILATEALKLSREVRVAKMLEDTKTYNGNVTTLTAKDSFVNKESSVIDVFKDVIEKMDASPNYAVISKVNALYLQSHPDFLGIYKTVNTDNKGIVPLDFIAQQLGLKRIFVGSARANSVKPGKTPVLQRVWGNDMIFFYQNPIAKPNVGLTFGLTAEYKAMNVQEYFDGKKGPYGVHYVKPVEGIKELILSGTCGYLVKDAFVKA